MMRQRLGIAHDVHRRRPGGPTTAMTVGQLAWQLLRLIAHGHRRQHVVFVPTIADPALRDAVQRHTGTKEWLVRKLELQPRDTFVIALLYLEDLP
jgi:hypothetical protein